jgi:predicted glycosyltransferase
MIQSRHHRQPTSETKGMSSRGRSIDVWVDLVSPSHPFLFRSLINAMDGVDPAVTTRKKTETVSLAHEMGFDSTTVGQDFDNATLRKLGIPLRTAQLAVQVPDCAVALCSRNAMCVLAAATRGIPSIHFTDNDITAHVDGLRAEELYNRFEAAATHNIVPAAFATKELMRWGADSESVHTYNGYKEDVYVAALDPDPSFPDRLPFEEYIVIRPEAMTAAYVDAERSLVPDLLTRAVERDINVVYLPRGRGDERHAAPYAIEDVFVPETALNGLQLAWHARCVLTGSGTMAREAASMETPAVSFFPNSLLSVDQALIEDSRVFHSRDAGEILAYVESIGERDAEPNLQRCQKVRENVAALTRELIDEEG